MSILQAVFLGIIQGLAEFLPISSSGHLVLFKNVFGINEPKMTFDVVLHLGTLVPVFIVFWKDIWALIKNPFQKMTLLVIVGTIPAVIFALLFDDFIEEIFRSGEFLAIGFFITAILLLYADRMEDGHKSDEEITGIDALIIGVMQGLAIPPGISRSGSTISGALFRKVSRESAAKFSFLLSIPAILGSAVLELKDIVTGSNQITQSQVTPMLFGFVAAALTGYIAIKLMLKLIREAKLKYFSFYVSILGILIIIDQFLTRTFF